MFRYRRFFNINPIHAKTKGNTPGYLEKTILKIGHTSERSRVEWEIIPRGHMISDILRRKNTLNMFILF